MKFDENDLQAIFNAARRDVAALYAGHYRETHGCEPEKGFDLVFAAKANVFVSNNLKDICAALANCRNTDPVEFFQHYDSPRDAIADIGAEWERRREFMARAATPDKRLARRDMAQYQAVVDAVITHLETMQP